VDTGVIPLEEEEEEEEEEEDDDDDELKILGVERCDGGFASFPYIRF